MRAPAGAGVRALLAAALLLGALARVAPLFDQDGRLLQQFPTEDGYLMLTVARNAAIGKGFTVADGTIPTNGVQPLATLVYVLPFLAAGGDRRLGVAGVQAIEIAAAVAAALLLWRLGTVLLRGRRDGELVAALAAAGWFASPVVVRHGMNGLETGLYVLALLAAQRFFIERDPARRPWPLGRCVALGALLGLAFWMRNDAVFLIAAACATHLAMGLSAGTAARRLPGVLVFGAVSVVVASPWLAFNLLRFGHLVPVSGRSEGFHFEVGENLPSLPAILVEYLSVVGAIPDVLYPHPAMIAACLALLAAAGVLLVRALREADDPALRSYALLNALFALGIATYYGAFFGVGFFLSRYMAPLSPALALLGAAIGCAVWRRLAAVSRPLATAFAVAPLLVATALHVRIYQRGVPHMHFQVVEWVHAHVPEDTWVGAVQTGTLGFFHDRTINLDGKVNPEAMAARERGRIPDYIVEKEIQYVADWFGIDDWMKYPVIAEHFEVVVRDPERNLTVLRRHGAPERTAAVSGGPRTSP